MMKLPKASNPPKLYKSYGGLLGRIAAGILVTVALVHLFRIDTLVPLIDNVLPGGRVWAGMVTVGIIASEVFAIPFALRLRLSTLAHIISGALLALAPLWWLLLTIWSFGTNQQIGQLGEFVPIYATTLLVVVNTLWIVLNYYTLYTLGYNRLQVRSLLRK